MNSFFTASGKKGFTRRLIVDSTSDVWSEHAEAALNNQTIGTIRIGLSELENSPIDWWECICSKHSQTQTQQNIQPDQNKGIMCEDEWRCIRSPPKWREVS